jgi:hypothetical protein
VPVRALKETPYGVTTSRDLLAQYFPRPDDPFAVLQMAIDAGAHGAFIQGEMGEHQRYS